VLRNTFGAVKGNGQWRIQRNRELEELYNHPNIMAEIKCNRLMWLGHIQRMPEDRMVKKIYPGHSNGRRL
jgi:hypothetical protein